MISMKNYTGSQGLTRLEDGHFTSGTNPIG